MDSMGDSADIASITRQFEKILRGSATRDVDSVMTCYWNDPGLVEYDIPAPTEFVGWDAVKANYQNQLADFGGEIGHTWDGPTVHVSGDLGHLFCVVHVSFGGPNGEPASLDARLSQLYRRIEGTWLVVHEHVSLPQIPAGEDSEAFDPHLPPVVR
jgi:ketosteroid isomerase-like protein